MPVLFTPPYTPLSKVYIENNSVVYRGVHYVLIFAQKHKSWVLVRTAVLTCSHSLCFEQTGEK